MNARDDHIFDLLRAFRADEAHIDDAIRSRIWADISEHDPEAALWLDTLDRGARIRQLRRRAPRPSRIIGAAAVLLLLTTVQLVLRSGGASEEPFVATGPSTTIPIPQDLNELADRVAAMHPTVFGETEDYAFTYLRGVRSSQADSARAVAVSVEKRWVATDGSGREVIDVEGDARDRDVIAEAGTFQIGFLPPDVARGLSDDADEVLATFERSNGVAGSQAAFQLVDLLTYAGLPGAARAGALRALGELGYEPAPGADPAPNLWRVEGPGPDGSRMRVDFDLRTGEVVAWTRLMSAGGFIRFTDIEVDLRPDTQGP